MIKTPSWSYSGITLFDQCPKKYYHLRVAKDITEPASTAMMYGTDVHEAAELFIRDGSALPEKYSYLKPLLDKLNTYPGQKHCELEMGLKRVDGRLLPCAFNDPDVWYRGIADLVIISPDGKLARIIDYKTGKSSRYADTKQLALMAACVFLHFPNVEHVKAALLFVVAGDLIKAQYDAPNGMHIFTELNDKLTLREAAYESEIFNPKKNFTCRAYCPVVICPHNGRSE
jgi:hypothetical protein